MSQLADLSSHLQSLLFLQGEVALADIGHWKVVEQPAVLQRVAGSVLPKRGELTFEASEKQSTSPALLQHLQKAWQSDQSSTTIQLEQELEKLRSSLNEKPKVLLPGMGWLSRKEGHLRFQSSNNNFLLQSFGLGPVDAYPVIPKQEKAAPVSAATTATATPSRRLWWLGLVAILLLLPVIWFIWKTPNDLSLEATEETPTEPAPAYQSGGLKTPTQSAYIEPNKPKNPEQNQTATPAAEQSSPSPLTEQPREEAASTEVPAAETTETPTPAETTAPPAEETTTETASTISRAEADYFIILGSFVNAKNVSDYRKEVEQAGYNSITQEAEGAVRVGIPVKGSEAEANEVLKKVKASLNRDAWLQKRQ